MKLKKAFVIVSIILVAIVGAGIGGFYYIDSKIFVPTTKESSNNTTDSVSAFQNLIDSISNQSGADNIILAGIDSRSKETASRTDSIMMVTIDRTNKAVRLTSFMRDMFVPIPGYSENYKINTAYFLGGPSLLLDTLNQNFNTNAQYYVTIDFKAFQSLVDKFNGIDIDVKSYEIKEMNKYIKEANWSNPDYVKTSGLQHLNGQQVLAYCRIRKVGNNDYERTERQRRVLTLLIEKARKESIYNLPSLLSSILPYIKTNIPSSQLLAFGISAYKFGETPVSTFRVPADGLFSDQVINGQAVLVPDLQKNTDLLNQFVTTGDVSQNENNLNVVQENNTDTNATDKSSIGESNIDQRNNIDVYILNSTGKSGLASKYKTKLQALGYKVIGIGNYTYKEYTSTLINDYSNQEYGDVILQDLKFGNILKKQKSKPLASVVIILGTDSE